MPTTSPTIDQLVSGWAQHFYSADRDIKWLRSEVEASVYLTPNTLLIGRIDAFGRDANGQLFFGEWKTSSPRDKNTWKQTWRLNPQSLTYGVLAETVYPGCNRFMVRKAFKTSPPSYDHAWYTYSADELAMWRAELIRIADEVRFYQGWTQPDHWPLNLSACHQFGTAYVCPFFEPACSQLNWQGKPANALTRVSHLDLERSLMDPLLPLDIRGVEETEALAALRTFGGGVSSDKEGPLAHPDGLVILDATRVKTWLSCRERFRREYVENVAVPLVEGSALDTGINFHELLAQYYAGMVTP
jgi:hypothetical protein